MRPAARDIQYSWGGTMKEKLNTARGVLLEIGFSGALIIAGLAVSALLGGANYDRSTDQSAPADLLLYRACDPGAQRASDSPSPVWHRADLLQKA